MTPKRRVAVFASVSMVTSVFLAVIFLFLSTRPSDRVVWQDCQPPSVSYGSFDPYCLSVVEGALEWSRMPFSVTRRYYLFIGRGKEAHSYGHAFDFGFTFGGDDPDAHIRASAAEWTPAGVTFTAKSGHTVFVPKANFIGGR